LCGHHMDRAHFVAGLIHLHLHLSPVRYRYSHRTEVYSCNPVLRSIDSIERPGTGFGVLIVLHQSINRRRVHFIVTTHGTLLVTLRLASPSENVHSLSTPSSACPPVEPYPPVPRCVVPNSATSTNSACSTR